MTMKHATQSAVTDLGVPGEIGPSEWNEAHVLSGASDDVDISGNTPVVVATGPAVTLAAGDSIRLEMFGYVRNTTGGTRTLTLGVRLDSTDLLEVSGSATVASSTDTPVRITAYIGVRSSSSTYITAAASLNPVGTAGSSVSEVSRNAWQLSTSDWTGSHTPKITGRGSAAGSGLNLRLAGYWMQKLP